MVSICNIRRLATFFFLARANSRSAITVPAFLHRTNMIDEKLTSLSFRNPSDGPREMILSCCATATQVFVNVVLREDPPPCASSEALSTTLHISLLQSDLECAWAFQAELLWVFFMGYMGCVAGPLRDWYVQQIERVTYTLGLSEKHALRDCLMGFLWVDIVCLPYFWALWEQIARREFDSGVIDPLLLSLEV